MPCKPTEHMETFYPFLSRASLEIDAVTVVLIFSVSLIILAVIGV